MKKNDIKFETLRKDYTKPIVIGLVVFIVVMSTLILKGSMAKYQLKQSVKLAEGTINYKMPDFNLLALNIQDESGEYQSASEVPSEGYALNEEMSYCEKLETDGTKTTLSDVTIEYKDGYLYFGKITQRGTKCYVYLDIYNNSYVARDYILAGKNVQTRTDFSTALTEDTTGTIYSAEDDDGTTYYFAGGPTDNYVYFAGYYWRIIRVNGDGSIRLIYDGTSALDNGTGSEDSQIGTSVFNPEENGFEHVGFMYTSGSIHGHGTSSTIKEVLDTWYTSNLADYASYIDTNAGFCGDRQTFTDAAGTSGEGTGTTTTYYGAYIRLITNKTPSYKCTYSSDLYTVSSSSKGNKALTNPIGLITADEASFAGFSTSADPDSVNIYLCRMIAFWTLSPSKVETGSTSYDYWGYLFGVGFGLYSLSPSLSESVRPVINLKSTTAFTGTGLANDPFVVVS